MRAYLIPAAYAVHRISGMWSTQLCRVHGGVLRPAADFASVSVRIMRLASGRGQHGQELIGGSKAAGLQHRRCHGSERFEFLARIRHAGRPRWFAGWRVRARVRPSERHGSLVAYAWRSCGGEHAD
jgi:hypothetical protein